MNAKLDFSMVEINSTWKVKPVVDPTVLPKGKVQAKFNAVTLPENQSADFGDVEPSIDVSAKHTTMGFQQNTYFAMRLDTIDELTESYVESLKEKEPNSQHHQADADNITLDDNLESFQAGPAPFNRDERNEVQGSVMSCCNGQNLCHDVYTNNGFVRARFGKWLSTELVEESYGIFTMEPSCLTFCTQDMDLKKKPKYLVTFTVGIAQRDNINAVIKKEYLSRDTSCV